MYYLTAGCKFILPKSPAACSMNPIFTKVYFTSLESSLLHKLESKNADFICSFSTGLCIARKSTE